MGGWDGKRLLRRSWQAQVHLRASGGRQLCFIFLPPDPCGLKQQPVPSLGRAKRRFTVIFHLGPLRPGKGRRGLLEAAFTPSFSPFPPLLSPSLCSPGMWGMEWHSGTPGMRTNEGFRGEGIGNLRSLSKGTHGGRQEGPPANSL